MLGAGTLAGASFAGIVVFAYTVRAFVSGLQRDPFDADFVVWQLSTIAFIAIAAGGLAGSLSGLLASGAARLTRAGTTRTIVTTLVVSIPPAVIVSVCARLFVTHRTGPANLAIGAAAGAITSVAFALLPRLDARLGDIRPGRLRRAVLALGGIGAVLGTLVGLTSGDFGGVDLPSVSLIYLLSPDDFEPPDPFLATVLGDAGLGASLGLLAASLAAWASAIGERFGRTRAVSLICFVAPVFLVAGGAGLVGSRVNGFFSPSFDSVTGGHGRMLIALGDRSAWPQAVLTGLEWGICGAALAIVVFAGLPLRLWRANRGSLLVGAIGGAVFAGLLAASTWAQTATAAAGIDADFADALVYPAPLGTSMALVIGALAGLLAVLTTLSLLSEFPRDAGRARSAVIAMGVVVLVGGIPLLHLAVYPDGEQFVPEPVDLLVNAGIVVLMLASAGTVGALRRTGLNR